MSRSRRNNVGAIPPQIQWTVVRGDTATFKAYVTDDARQPLEISDWSILMKIKRPNNVADLGVITDDAELILTLNPGAEIDEEPGYFTVSLLAEESEILETGDIFDIQLSRTGFVWTVAQGKMAIVEDVTD